MTIEAASYEEGNITIHVTLDREALTDPSWLGRELFTEIQRARQRLASRIRDEVIHPTFVEIEFK